MRILTVAATVLLVGACGGGASKARPPATTPASTTSAPASRAPSTTSVRAAPSTTSVPAPSPGVSGHIDLPSTSVAAGSTENGTFVIENGTGAPLHLTTGGPIACRPSWTVILTSQQVPQEPVFATSCVPRPLVVGIGETRLPFTLRSDYQTCSETGRAQGALTPPCVKNANGLDVSPPLPAGEYRATFFSDIAGFIPVQSVPVTVVASG